MPNISYTYVPDAGWTGRGFDISHAPVDPSRLRLTVEPKGKAPYEVPILSAEAADGVLRIGTGDFNYREAWTLRVGEDAYTRRDMDIERCEGLERFEAKRDGGVIYRLYTPKAAGPRPMILFLHGGGNGGDDLITHIAADYGCIQAYNLDGGGSAAMYYNGDIFTLNRRRAVTDIVYFATLVKK